MRSGSSQMRTSFGMVTFIMLVIAVVVVVAIFGSRVYINSGKTSAIDAAESMGYTDVTVGLAALNPGTLLGCSDEDDLVYRMSATGIDGIERELVYCTGAFFKGGTIRFP